MNEQTAKDKGQKGTEAKEVAKPISYRLKCEKTANGLSHFVMYGDMAEKKTLL